MKENLKKGLYITGKFCTKTVTVSVIAALIAFGIGFVDYLILDGVEAKERNAKRNVNNK